MSLPISASNQSALASKSIKARDFLWIVAKDRDTGDPQTVGFWSDVGNVSLAVIDPDTGSSSTRDWYGSGGLISISYIPRIVGIQVQRVTIKLSQINSLVEQAVRLYECKQAPVQVFRGMFNLSTNQLVAPALCRFVGFIDEIDIRTPKEGEVGSVSLTVASHTQELNRSNPDTRSDASQKLRSSTDNFFADAAVAGDWDIMWGKKKGKGA